MTPHLRLYRGGESNSTNGKIEESPAKWHNQNVTRSQGKPPLRRRFGETFFQGFPKAMHRVIKFVGSDRRLRTLPSRSYCWGSHLRVSPPKGITPSGISPEGYLRWLQENISLSLVQDANGPTISSEGRVEGEHDASRDSSRWASPPNG